jgi:hypothetical protein
VDGHGEEEGAAWATLVFPFCAGYGETGAKQGGWFLVAGLGKVVEQGAVFFNRRQEALATETVECVLEVQLQ